MRLSREVVAKREARMAELFTANPDMSVTKANELLAAEFAGRKMAPGRAMELKKAVLDTTKAEEEVQS